MGVSESSLKRWCDQGLIRSGKTPGGHRRLEMRDVVQFLRENNRPLVHAEAIGLPAGLGQDAAPESSGKRSPLTQALTDGRDAECHRILFDRYLAGAGVVELFEQLVTPAMHELGDLWTCGTIDVFHERRACEIVSRLIHDLRAMMPRPSADAPLAIGGAPAGDNYQLATNMVEMTLHDAGWKAESMGSDIPFASLLAAAEEKQPDLMWMSLTSSGSDSGQAAADLRDKLVAFAERLPEKARLVVGGRAVEQSALESAGRVTVCRSLRDLVSFAEQQRG